MMDYNISGIKCLFFFTYSVWLGRNMLVFKAMYPQKEIKTTVQSETQQQLCCLILKQNWNMQKYNLAQHTNTTLSSLQILVPDAMTQMENLIS